MKKVMLFADRYVRQVNPSTTGNSRQRLDAVRNLAAWVLLGEPGSGKTEAFKKEAEATGGKYIRISEFIDTNEMTDLQGQILFLDGLDEIRASSFDNDSLLYKIKAKLQQLGKPHFRIACRAADWFASIDDEDIKGASLDKKLTVFLLEPFTEDDIFSILSKNHNIKNPGSFVEKSKKTGVGTLLENPQTLGLLACAIRDGQWPSTRQETFKLACEKLIEENNKRHRIANRDHTATTEKLFNAAGHLCAVLLLSDKIGLALDPEQADDRFPYLDNYSPPESDTAFKVVKTRLFHLESKKEECFVPSHRNIAEYLGGRWLAIQVSDGLPLGRILNLLLGRNQRTVAGLRGLYAWFALHCQTARTRMIETDPLTIILYGDAKPLPLQDKRWLLAGLQREAESYAGFRGTRSSTHAFGALADSELCHEFIAGLKSTDRGDANQAFVYCILDILVEGETIPGLSETVKNVLLDDSRWGVIRDRALQVWLKFFATPQQACSMLDSFSDGSVADGDDELLGQLLCHLYPNHIAPENLFNYLHTPKKSNFTGSYILFWVHDLPKKMPEIHLPILLDQLAARSDPLLSETKNYRLSRMTSTLLVPGILQHGDSITDERLFEWLGIGINEDNNLYITKNDRAPIAAWLEKTPERYKAVLLLCFKLAGDYKNTSYKILDCKLRLHNAVVPKDIGLWHLEQASLTDSAILARVHLTKAMKTLFDRQGDHGLSLEQIETWADKHADRTEWLKELLVVSDVDWRLKRAVRKKSHHQRHIDDRRKRTSQVKPHLEAIQSGRANAALMHQLALVWKNHYTDISGKTIAERFAGYSGNGQLLAAAESGFLLCLERANLPTVREIIKLNIEQQEHLIRQPCLIGMALRWQKESSSILSIPGDTLRRMLAFQITYGFDTPDWLTHLVTACPSIVSEVLIDYAGLTLKSKLEHINYISVLEQDANYRAVAIQVVPILLQRFPVRSKANKLRYLKHLLKAALRYHMEQLPSLVQKKLTLKSMDVAQKTMWMVSGMLLDPEQYENILWQYVGNSWVRANYISEFLCEDFDELERGYCFSAKTIGKLIECLLPHAELEYPQGGGFASDALTRGEHIRALIFRLSTSKIEDSENEIERLLALPSLAKLKLRLEHARQQLQLKQRESEFHFLPITAIAQVLANKEPANVQDLTALTLDHLDDIAEDIRQNNDDGFRAYWNIENKMNTSKREENHCRDDLLRRLRVDLDPLGIDCQPEGDYFNDKRADIRISFQNKFELPIEIKRDDNKTLWPALRTQLINQYSIAPKTAGYGLYLVLWFGKNGMPAAPDGGKKPRHPEELKNRLKAQLSPSEQQKIFVRVLDVSWPEK